MVCCGWVGSRLAERRSSRLPQLRPELIGLHHSVALRKAAPQAQFHCVEGAGHSDVHQVPSFRKAVNAALVLL